MARTEIPTYTTNQLITAAHGNTYWRDNEAAHWAAIGAIVCDMEQIEEKVLSAAGTFDFTGIPSTYKHLELCIQARGVAAVAAATMQLRFNNDSGGNYDSQIMQAYAATVNAESLFGQTSARSGYLPGGSAAANLFGTARISVMDYANAANNKSFVAEGGHKEGTSSGNTRWVALAGWWRSNNAINRITLFYNNATTTFAVGSVATLYGLK